MRRVRRFTAADVSHTTILNTVEDEDEDEELENNINVISMFDRSSCVCLNSCFGHLSDDDVNQNIMNLREMTKDEKEMFIMGVLSKIGFDKTTSRNTQRKRTRYIYLYKGQTVCRDAFLQIYDITDRVLSSLASHMNTNGLTPRVHGNKGKLPHHALKYDDVKRCVDFIRNYSEEYGIPQPEAPRGSDGIPPVFLPASDTKKQIHTKYEKCLSEINPVPRIVKLASFKDLWLKCIPHIKISKPRDDVCCICEKLRKKIADAVTEDEKMDATREFTEHLQEAKKEREEYRRTITDTMSSFENTDSTSVIDPAVYTFDFAQHFQLPHHARQMGPTYFAALRRIQLFGVRIDTTAFQLNFMIDEDQTIGKTFIFCLHFNYINLL